MGAGNAAFTRSYRTRQVGLDQGTRRLLMAAGALGVLLLAGMGSWAVLSRRTVNVPVIEADSRPLRVKPDNPGGLQVAGADEQVMGGTGGSGIDSVAPPAETPAPQALRAQLGQLAAPRVGPAPASPLPDTAPPPARAAAAPAPPRAPAAGPLIQLAAVDSEAAAKTEWQRLSKRLPDLLGDRRPVMQKAEKDGQAVWRIRLGGFADVAEATGFCAKVRSKGGNCALASF